MGTYLTNKPDVFEEYNNHVKELLTKMIMKLGAPKRKIQEAINQKNLVHKKIEELKKQIEEYEQQKRIIKGKMDDAQNDSQLTRQRAQDEALQKAMRDALKYFKDDFDEINNEILRLQNTIKLLQAHDPQTLAENGIDVELITDNIMGDEIVIRNSAQVCRNFADRYGRNYGCKPEIDSKGEVVRYSDAFQKIYKTTYENSQNDETYELYKDEEPDVQGLEEYLAGFYHFNPYLVLDILKAFLFLPIFIVGRIYKSDNILTNLKDTVYCLIHGIKRIPIIIGIITWFVEVCIIRSTPTWFQIVLTVFVAVAIGVFFFTKKKTDDAIKEIISRQVYYERLAGDRQYEIDAEVDRQCSEVIQSLQDDINTLDENITVMNNENARLQQQAKDNFKFDDSDFQRTMQEIHQKYNAELLECDEKIRNIQVEIDKQVNMLPAFDEKVRQAQQEYEQAKDLTCCYYNAPNERDKDRIPDDAVKNMDGSFFDYVYDYVNLCILMYSDMTQSLWVGKQNGKMVRQPLTLGGSYSTMVPRTFPGKLVKVNIEQRYGNEVAPEVLTDFKSLLSDLAKEANETMCQYLNLSGSNVDFSPVLEHIDFDGFYEVNLLPYNGAGCIFFYDGASGDDIKFVTDFLLRNIYKSTYFTTDLRATKFKFFVSDKTRFEQMDPTNKGSAKQLEVVRDSKTYLIYRKDEKSKLLKDMYEYGDGTKKEVLALGCSDVFEYMNKKFDSTSNFPKPINYLVLWDDVSEFNSTDLDDILKATGGSRALGDNQSAVNMYGIVPFIVLDKSKIFLTQHQIDAGERFDTNKLDILSKLCNEISPENFFEFNKTTGLFESCDRNKLIKDISIAKSKANSTNA